MLTFRKKKQFPFSALTLYYPYQKKKLASFYGFLATKTHVFKDLTVKICSPYSEYDDLGSDDVTYQLIEMMKNVQHLRWVCDCWNQEHILVMSYMPYLNVLELSAGFLKQLNAKELPKYYPQLEKLIIRYKGFSGYTYFEETFEILLAITKAMPDLIVEIFVASETTNGVLTNFSEKWNIQNLILREAQFKIPFTNLTHLQNFAMIQQNITNLSIYDYHLDEVRQQYFGKISSFWKKTLEEVDIGSKYLTNCMDHFCGSTALKVTVGKSMSQS